MVVRWRWGLSLHRVLLGFLNFASQSAARELEKFLQNLRFEWDPHGWQRRKQLESFTFYSNTDTMSVSTMTLLSILSPSPPPVMGNGGNSAHKHWQSCWRCWDNKYFPSVVDWSSLQCQLPAISLFLLLLIALVVTADCSSALIPYW